MGLLTQDILGFGVEFYGVQDYANSGTEDRPIRAYVGEVRWREFDSIARDPVALLAPLAVSRLLSMTRRAPHYVAPLMSAVEACNKALLEARADQARDFRVRSIVETDPMRLTHELNMSGGSSLPYAEFNSALPIVVDDPEQAAEKTTLVKLRHARRGGAPWAEFKFGMRSSNPLVTAGAAFAVIEHIARQMDYEDVVQPMAAGLSVLSTVWRGCGEPTNVPVRMAKDMDQVISQAVLAEDPLAMAGIAKDSQLRQTGK